MSLQDEISRIAGVVEASVDPVEDGPVGVRISVREGFDHQEIARAVQEALRRRGLSSAMADPASSGDTEDDPQGIEPEAAGSSATPPHAEDPTPPAPAVLGPPRGSKNGAQSRLDEVSGTVVEKVPSEVPSTGPIGGSTAEQKPPAPPPHPGSGGVSRAALSEGPTGVEVEVRLNDGTRATRQAGATSEAAYGAVIGAVYDAGGRKGAIPVVRSVEFELRGERTSVTVVLERDGRVVIGSAMVGATEVLAVARAAWAALISS